MSEQVMKKCAACRTEKPVNEMKTCMHSQMHYYVCDSKCMDAFYNPPKQLSELERIKADYAALQAECERLRAELSTVKKVAYGNLELLNEIEQLRAELAALKAQTPEYGPAPAISIKWHKSPESVHREMWESVAIGEGMTYEQLMADCDICAEDEDGNEVVLESDADIKGMKAQGCWAFVDTEAQTIHAWADQSVDDGLLIHMLAHEIGHATGKPDKDGIREEFRAEQFGSVAALAYSLFTDWRKNHSAQNFATATR